MKLNLMQQLKDKLLSQYAISEETFFDKKSRDWNTVEARYMFYYLCNERRIRNNEMKKFMESYGHSVTNGNICHGIKEIRYKVNEDHDYVTVCKKIQNEVKI